MYMCYGTELPTQFLLHGYIVSIINGGRHHLPALKFCSWSGQSFSVEPNSYSLKPAFYHE